MKRFLPLVAIIALPLAGCSTSGMSKLVGQLKNDPATVSASVTSVYGTVKLIRVGGQTNNSVTVSPDGTVTITPKLAQ